MAAQAHAPAVTASPPTDEPGAWSRATSRRVSSAFAHEARRAMARRAPRAARARAAPPPAPAPAAARASARRARRARLGARDAAAARDVGDEPAPDDEFAHDPLAALARPYGEATHSRSTPSCCAGSRALRGVGRDARGRAGHARAHVRWRAHRRGGPRADRALLALSPGEVLGLSPHARRSACRRAPSPSSPTASTAPTSARARARGVAAADCAHAAARARSPWAVPPALNSAAVAAPRRGRVRASRSDARRSDALDRPVFVARFAK